MRFGWCPRSGASRALGGRRSVWSFRSSGAGWRRRGSGCPSPSGIGVRGRGWRVTDGTGGARAGVPEPAHRRLCEPRQVGSQVLLPGAHPFQGARTQGSRCRRGRPQPPFAGQTAAFAGPSSVDADLNSTVQASPPVMSLPKPLCHHRDGFAQPLSRCCGLLRRWAFPRSGCRGRSHPVCSRAGRVSGRVSGLLATEGCRLRRLRTSAASGVERVAEFRKQGFGCAEAKDGGQRRRPKAEADRGL